jgi:AcrR family transcriptional regulator
MLTTAATDVAVTLDASGEAISLLPPTADSDGTLRRFLEEAVRLFAARGYAGVSIREIAAPVGVKPSAMYAHFSSKEAVLEELINIAHGYFDREVSGAVAAAEPDPESRLRALVDANVRFHAHYPRLATVANYELRNLGPKQLQRALRQRARWEKLAEDIVRDGIDNGAFTCSNPKMAMRALGAMCIRVSAWIERETEMTVDEIAATYSDYVMKLVV